MKTDYKRAAYDAAFARLMGIKDAKRTNNPNSMADLEPADTSDWDELSREAYNDGYDTQIAKDCGF